MVSFLLTGSETNSSSVAEELTELFNLVYHDVLRVVNKARKKKEVSYPNIDFYASYVMNVCLFGNIILHFGSLMNFQNSLLTPKKAPPWNKILKNYCSIVLISFLKIVLSAVIPPNGWGFPIG